MEHVPFGYANAEFTSAVSPDAKAEFLGGDCNKIDLIMQEASNRFSVVDSIFYMSKVKPVMRRNICRVALDPLKLLYELFFRGFAGRDAQQKSHHKANLGAEKAVAFKHEDETSLVAVGVGAVDDANVMFHVGAAFFEQFEIMGPLEALDRVNNRVAVKGGDKGDEVVFERVAASLFDHVAVDPFAGAVAGMEVIADEFDALNADGRGKVEIEHLFQPRKIVPVVRKIQMHHLMGRVDAAVGSSRAFGESVDAQTPQRDDERSDDGFGRRGLLLGTHKRRAVVAHRDFDAVQKRFPTRRL